MTELEFIKRGLTIKEPPDFTVVSTFAGCGGSSTGYVWAGGKVLLAIEWDDNAVETYKLNYPNTDVYHGDIANISVDEILERTGLEVGKLDILDGSPPCQGFSTAGKRQIDDERNQLFREYVRLLQGLKPKVFVMENVSGMVKGKMKLLFAEILTELKASGYKVSAKLLNAMYLGVPQSRERIIFIGVRDDLGVQPSHPKPQTRPTHFKQAVNDIDNARHQTSRNLTDLQIKRWYETERGKSHHERFGLNRLAWNKPVRTIQKTSGSGGHMHPDVPRLLHVSELVRCASFPDLYQFIGKFDDAVNRIGNSVPPEMMRRIALHIKENILKQIIDYKKKTPVNEGA